MTKKIYLIFGMVIFLSILFLSKPAFAEDDKNTINSSVAPALMNLELKKGEVTNSLYTYTNGTDKDLKIVIDVRAFIPSDGEHGTPLFVDSAGRKITSDLENWISFEKKEYEVKSGAKVTIDFKVNTPSNAKNGKYFAAIFNTEITNDIKGGSAIKKEIGVTLVANVTDKPVESAATNDKKTISKAPLIISIIIAAIILLSLIIAILANKRKKL